MLWLALTGLAACAALLVALPFLRTRARDEAPMSELDIHKARLAALAREEAAGDIDTEAAAIMRTEIERRIVEAPDVAPPAGALARFDRLTAIAVAAIVVLGSAVLYTATGRPSVGGGDAPSAAEGAPQNLADIDAAIARLQERLEQSPDDVEGWRMLGWSYFETGRYAQSVEAYRRAVALAPDETAHLSALAEASTWANDGTVSTEARADFRNVLARDPTDERARYFLALAKAQQGDLRGAIDDWIEAAAAAAPDSPWAAIMRADAQAAARDAGVDISGRLPPAPNASAAPTAAPHPIAPSGAASESNQAQQDMVADMVDSLEQRLARNPRDADGWVLLMRSRMVMNQPDRARAALASGLSAFNGDGASQRRLREAAAELSVPGASR